MRSLVMRLIRWYQRYLAWLNGYSVCRFTPRCSEYTYQAVDKYGVFKGLYLGILRVSRCHPLHAGGWDPVV